MTNSWKALTKVSGIDVSTRVRLLHSDYQLDKRRKSRLLLTALLLDLLAVACSLALVVLIVAQVFATAAPQLGGVLAGTLLAICVIVSLGAERRLRSESEAISAKLLGAERRLWRAGITDFTSEHVARHQQPLISTSSTVTLKERRSPSGADLVATERLMQTYLDLVVAPFGSVTQVRSEVSSLELDRDRIARTLGAHEASIEGPFSAVGVLFPSSVDPTNSAANVAMLSQACLWQELDRNRLLVCGPSFRPEQFDPWEPESSNRLTVYLPQLGREATPAMFSSQVALLFAERRDLLGVSLFCHHADQKSLRRSLNRSGLNTSTVFRYDPAESTPFKSAKDFARRCFYQLNAPRLETPLTFDVGRQLEGNTAAVMGRFFKESSAAVLSALNSVDEVRSVERYNYLPSSHQIEVVVDSWRTSEQNRQDLLWEILRSLAAFYRVDGDWRRGGSPSVSLVIDQVSATRSGEFMEYLAVARQTRELLRV